MSEIKTVFIEEKEAVVIKDKVGMFKLASVMGPAYRKIQEVSQFEGLHLDKVPFTSYVVQNWKKTTQMGFFGMLVNVLFHKWEIEMGFIINGEATLDHVDDIDVISIPGGKFLETTHIGAYKNVGETYKKLYAFAEENNLTMGGKSYEFYENDPTCTPEKELSTKVLVPLQ